jgi:hypothetical protein
LIDMRYLAFLVAMLASVPAYAMGRYVNLELVAWNADGSAALVVRTETSSGTVGMTQNYILVAVGAQPRVFTFNDTQDGDTSSQKVDRASCLRAADALSRELVVKRFRASIRRAGCNGDRAVVLLPAATLHDAAASLLTTPPKGPTSPRETAMWEAAKVVARDVDDARASVASKATAGGVTRLGVTAGPLILVLWGENGDSTGPAHAATVEKGVIGPDRRDPPP